MIKKILTVSRDRTILLARNDVLAIAGFSVSSPRTPAEAVHILATSEVAVIVLGHSVPKAEREELCGQFREIRPDVPIIVLYDVEAEDDELADAFVPAHAGPEVLIQAIQLCLRERDSKRRPA